MSLAEYRKFRESRDPPRRESSGQLNGEHDDICKTFGSPSRDVLCFKLRSMKPALLRSS
jgi:hypothetical protein